MRPRHGSRLTNVQAGALVLAIIAVGTFLGFRKEIPFQHHWTLKAAFSSSNNLRPNSPVRIAGVNVGKVTKVEHLDGRQAAMVTMRIDDKGLPIHKDAQARIRPRIFLEGNFFVDIQPGSPSTAELDDGDTIPINQTAAPVQLDQVLTALQKDTRGNLQGLLGGLSKGLSGKGADGYRRSQRYWKPAYRDGAIVSEATLGVGEHDLSDYVRDAGATAAALDADSAKLRSLITDFNTTAGALAARQGELAAAVGELPRTLRAGLPALASLNRAFPPLRRLITDLRPGVRSSTATLRANLPLVRQLRALMSQPELRGLVADLRPTVPQLARLNRRSIPLMEQTRLASSCQNEVVLPWSKDTIQDKVFPATGPVFEDSLKVLPGLAGESRTGDANGQWFRVLVAGGLYSAPNGNGGFMLTDKPLLGANPPGRTTRPPLKPDVPCETQERPDLRSVPSPIESRKAVVPASRQAAYHRFVERSIDRVRKLVARDPSARKAGLKVSAKPVTKADIAKLVKGRR